ncbi:MAG: DUF3108 domain-containing protein [Pseudomonadota bacterium]
MPRRLFSLIALIALTVAAVTGFSPSTPPATAAITEKRVAPGRALDGTFVLKVGGMTAARLTLDAGRDDRRYRVEASIATTGVVRAFREAGIEAEVEGDVGLIGTHGGLAPRRYRSTSTDEDDVRRVAIDYIGAAPSVRAEPPYDRRNWAIDPATQTDALDPLSAILSIFGAQEAGTLCDREIRVFDARRRFAVALAEPEGPGTDGTISCEATYRRLGGFKPRLLEEPPFPFRVTFAEGADGLWQLVRAAGQSPLGTAVIMREEG